MIEWAKRLSAAGLIFLALHEGFSPTPYRDTVGVWTNGFGNTHDAQKKVTVTQALVQLNKNAQTAVQAVTACVTKPMKQYELDAFVDFTYNVGNTAFCNSTLVKKFNAGDSAGACAEILRWVKQPELKSRRQDEYNLCIGVAQ